MSGTDGGTADGGNTPGATGVNVLTQKYNNARTGLNDKETILNPTNVKAGMFGKLFGHKVDGQIAAQPLVVSGLEIRGKKRNVVYVLTMKNTLYAFDADSAAETMPLLMAEMGPPVPNNNMFCSKNCNDLRPFWGAMGTPVIDLESKTIYFVSKQLENGQASLKLNALDIVTGMKKMPSVGVTGSVQGNGFDGYGSQGGMVSINQARQMNRPGLLLQNGRVYVGLGSHGDQTPYHGWVVGFNATTLQRECIYNTTPNSQGGAIWASGNGLVGDGQHIYFATGNADNPDPMSGAAIKTPGTGSLGEALVKIDNDCKLVDWHVCADWKTLDERDIDYGISGPMLIPGSNRLIMSGKEPMAYLYDKNKLGAAANNNSLIKRFKGSGGTGNNNTINNYTSGGWVYWKSAMGEIIYVWPSHSRLLGFKFDGNTVADVPVVVGPMGRSPGWSHGTMTVSSNGDKDGILWLLQPDTKPNQYVSWGRLRAFDLSKANAPELFTTGDETNPDKLGLYASYNYPTVANGKVYAPTWNGAADVTRAEQPNVSPSRSAGELVVYGLK